MSAARVIICGGGTGGHLYPALALSREIRRLRPDIEIIHVGSRRAAEQRIMAGQNLRFLAMAIEGLKGRGLKSVRGLLLLPGAFARSFLLLVRLKPALVVGVGGYSSGPLVLLAAWMRVPTLILEQNVRPGFTNRRLARWADRAAVAFSESLSDFRGKGVHLGNPVREEFAALPGRAHGPRLSLLVFGGSQGSHLINRMFVAALPLLAGIKDRLDIVHQTGPADLVEVRRGYAENGFEGAAVEAYFDDMPARIGRSDLVVCRAGATTCAELIAARRAAILVPFAGAADNHQAANAAVLKKAGGAEVLNEAHLTPVVLAERIRRILSRPEALTAMENGLDALKTPRAAERIAALALDVMAGRNQE
jgi:UDP-N-acetylglucosamine--N-acetylmuramyl-(pentapeptide) pyrophosphoryl-undecaprenol N-acetylglucosamine transferase